MNLFALALISFPFTLFVTMIGSWLLIDGDGFSAGMASYLYSIPLYFIQLFCMVRYLSQSESKNKYRNYWICLTLACLISGQINYWVYS